MATLSDIRTKVQRDIRDINAAVFTSAELNDLINQALDAISDIRPREVTETVAISASTFTYDPTTDFTRIFRVDVHNSSDSYQRMLTPGSGGRTTGWDYFGGILYLNPNETPTAGDKYHLYGYARYIELTVDSATTDASAEVLTALRVFVRMEAFAKLSHDRAAFQQWQASPGNTDVTESELENLRRGAVARWNMERQRLRKMRRLE